MNCGVVTWASLCSSACFLSLCLIVYQWTLNREAFAATCLNCFVTFINHIFPAWTEIQHIYFQSISCNLSFSLFLRRVPSLTSRVQAWTAAEDAGATQRKAAGWVTALLYDAVLVLIKSISPLFSFFFRPKNNNTSSFAHAQFFCTIDHEKAAKCEGFLHTKKLQNVPNLNTILGKIFFCCLFIQTKAC